ncbi:MAG: c-type cytochrome, partial [Gammaproteobacteria bacterium]
MKTTHLFLIASLAVTACSDNPSPTVPRTTTPDSQRVVLETAQQSVSRERDSAKVMRGRKLFAQNCASCHGTRAEGGPLWSKTGPLTKDPSPPLNGTGHTWYH